MKTAEIEVGKSYRAKVSGNLTTVRVEAIRKQAGFQGGRETTVFDVTNLTTGRRTTFRSSLKFRNEVGMEPPRASKRLIESAAKAAEAAVSHKPEVVETDTAPLGDNIGTPAPKHGLAQALKTRRNTTTDSAAHLIIEARAGTGKTTTLIEGLKRVKGIESLFTPSPQQDKVWNSMSLSSPYAQTICFVAFNTAIASVLKNRVPAGCEAMTMHALGRKALFRAFGNLELNQDRLNNLVSDELGENIRDIRRYKGELLNGINKVVKLCKQNLVGFIDGKLNIEGTDWDTDLEELSADNDLELNGNAQRIFKLVPKILNRCIDVRHGEIDFEDMYWLSIALDLPVPKYDLLLVDEAQDLNRCQQQLALKAGRRLILCGDPKQAIYAFAGADSRSMPRMSEILSATDRGCETLPLTVTRRCGKAIVDEARKIVKDFEAHESNGPGKVGHYRFEGDYKSDLPDNEMKSRMGYSCHVSDGDMVICRTNAPLVSQCFRFLKEGRKANIQGKDIGTGLIKLIDRMKCVTVVELFAKLDDWYHAESRKESAKRNPNEARLIALSDKFECLKCFCEDRTTVAEVKQRIETIFTDESQGGVLFSSGHKAKGLEAKRVFILKIKGGEIPHPMAKTEAAREQEMNLYYVMITRAIEELYFVTN